MIYFMGKLPSPTNKAFCVAPWVHLHVWPDGQTFPCCYANHHAGNIGNTRTQSLEEIWNSEAMRQLRLDMLAGKQSSMCERCSRNESLGIMSHRDKLAPMFEKHREKIESTAEDGHAGAVNLAYMDFRFSNLCNLKCRSCSPRFSNSWYNDHVSLYGTPEHPRNMQVRENLLSFWHELEPLLEHVEEINFAGGEPLLSEEHWKILHHLIAIKRTDVKLQYITNFSNMTFQGHNIFDLWSQFKHVKVLASLDGSYGRGEYLRKNLKWEDAVAHRREMLAKSPHAAFHAAPTISLYNVWHIPDFHREWFELGLMKIEDLCLNILTEPKWMSIQVLPHELKRQVREKYLRHIEWMKSLTNIPYWEPDVVAPYFAGVVEHMEQVDASHLLPQWRSETARVDKLRQENVFEIFPELASLKEATPLQVQI